jgi:hypothetical protein
MEMGDRWLYIPTGLFSNDIILDFEIVAAAVLREREKFKTTVQISNQLQ